MGVWIKRKRDSSVAVYLLSWIESLWRQFCVRFKCGVWSERRTGGLQLWVYLIFVSSVISNTKAVIKLLRWSLWLYGSVNMLNCYLLWWVCIFVFDLNITLHSHQQSFLSLIYFLQQLPSGPLGMLIIIYLFDVYVYIYTNSNIQFIKCSSILFNWVYSFVCQRRTGAGVSH